MISKIFWEKLQHGMFPEAVGGPTLGADPLTAGLILLSAQNNQPLIGLIIRKEPKGHGTGVWIEGLENTKPSMNVALLEDVVTTAASSLHSIEKIKAAGLQVSRVLCVVDREEGGVEALHHAGFSLESIFQATELKEAARRGKS